MSPPTKPTLEIHQDRRALGKAAARRFQQRIEQVLQAQPVCRVIFGCAPSQDEFLAALVTEARLTAELWKRVMVFHMDEYVGLPESHPQSFRAYLWLNFLNHVPTAGFEPIRGDAPSAPDEARRYAALLAAAPIDLIAMGIGENGHVAFNDPPVADFADPVLVKVVAMDAVCRQQQVNDGCFVQLDDVPRRAITITLPVFARAGNLYGIVPGIRKAQAVRNALLDPVGPACPATILRTHAQAELFLDLESASIYLSSTRS